MRQSHPFEFVEMRKQPSTDVQGARQLLDIRSRSVSGTDDVEELAHGVRVVPAKGKAEAAEDLVNSLVSVPELKIFCQKNRLLGGVQGA